MLQESSRRPDPLYDDQRRRYFAVTQSGRTAAVAEARRLEELLVRAERLQLLDPKGATP